MSRLAALWGKREAAAGFLPFVYCSSSLTARILRCSVREYLEQASVQANSVISVKQLFDPDGIVLGFNPVLVEECWGGGVEYPEGFRLPVCTRPAIAARFCRTPALEALVQAVQWAKKVSGGTALIAPVPGVSYLSAPGAEVSPYEMVARVGMALAEAGPDVVAVYERLPLPDGYEEGLEPLLNVLEHYGIASMLVLAPEVPANLPAVDRFDGLLVDHRRVPAAGQDRGLVLGAMLGLGPEPPRPLPGARFVSTPWEVDGESPSAVARVREMRARLSDLRA